LTTVVARERAYSQHASIVRGSLPPLFATDNVTTTALATPPGAVTVIITTLAIKTDKTKQVM